MSIEDRVAEWERIPSSDEMSEMMKQAKRYGLSLVKEVYPDDDGVEGCWLGGEPTLPPEIAWPMLDLDDPEFPVGLPYGLPMHFLCQVDLSKFPRGGSTKELPNSGTLFFFFDPVCGPSYDIGNVYAQVIFIEDDVSLHPPR